MSAPTQQQVAEAAARYCATEFTTFTSWFSYEDELARELMKDDQFRCAVDYATKQVMTMISYNKTMSVTAAQHGGGARGIAVVVGHIVGEWLAGKTTTIDQELMTW
jgi:hypothetical protein